MTTEIRKLTDDFIATLHAWANERTNARLKDALAVSTIKTAPIPARGFMRDGRRKGPVQLCPIPSCQARACPRFAMVCAKHRDTPKAKVAKYREARRAAKRRAAQP